MSSSPMDKEKRVCHLSSVHKALDTRIFHKEAVSLAEFGYETYLIAQHVKDENIDGVNIISVAAPKGSRFSRMTKTVWEVYKKAIKIDAGIYHFHDTELIPIGVLLKLKGKKVIYDIHEDLPKDILQKKYLGNKFFRKMISFGAALLQSFADWTFDATATVTPDIHSKFNKRKSILLRNFPVIKHIDEVNPKDLVKEKFVVIYVGGLTQVRGIKELIDAFNYTNEAAELWLFGNWENQKFMDICISSPGWKSVKYFGNLPQKEVFSYMKIADVGVVTFLPIENHVSAMPNKPFEYISCHLPIIMSDFPLWRNIFSDCAIFVDPEDSREISSAIIKLMNDKELAKSMGEKGRRMIDDSYSWEAESKKLLDLYQKLSK
ncbi:MAG: glycosyltransferase [Bacteroidota bacterium]|nr:glycosyltransferase [Bacteroidota bacterium]